MVSQVTHPDIGRINWINNNYTKEQFVSMLDPYKQDCIDYLGRLGFLDVSSYYHPKSHMIIFKGRHAIGDVNRSFLTNNRAFPRAPLTRNLIVFTIHENKLYVSSCTRLPSDNYIYQHYQIFGKINDYLRGMGFPLLVNTGTSRDNNRYGGVTLPINAPVIKQYDEKETNVQTDEYLLEIYKKQAISSIQSYSVELKSYMSSIEYHRNEIDNKIKSIEKLKSKMDYIRSEYYTKVGSSILEELQP